MGCRSNSSFGNLWKHLYQTQRYENQKKLKVLRVPCTQGLEFAIHGQSMSSKESPTQ